MKTLSNMKHQKGFTLVELLVVIGLLGLLMVGTLIAINPLARFNAAKDATSKAGVDQVSSALQSYLAANSAYPTTAQTYTVMVGANGELSAWPNGPSGSALTYVGNATGTNAAVYFTMLAPASSSLPIWCYQTSTGKAQPVANSAACTAP